MAQNTNTNTAKPSTHALPSSAETTSTVVARSSACV